MLENEVGGGVEGGGGRGEGVGGGGGGRGGGYHLLPVNYSSYTI
jgi:hypothetical protein